MRQAQLIVVRLVINARTLRDQHSCVKWINTGVPGDQYFRPSGNRISRDKWINTPMP